MINWGLLFFDKQSSAHLWSIKSSIKTRTTQLSVFVANWQHRDLGKFPWQQIKMVAKESMKHKYVFNFFEKHTLIMTISAKLKNCTFIFFYFFFLSKHDWIIHYFFSPVFIYHILHKCNTSYVWQKELSRLMIFHSKVYFFVCLLFLPLHSSDWR